METKRILRLATVLVMSLAILVPLASVAAKKEKGSAVFTKQSYNFGIVKENGGPVSCEFEFVNKGKGNLVIFDATADCGCTRPDYPKNPIAPGKRGKIKVSYNPLGRPGGFDKTITVKTNGSPSKIRLKIKGTVSPAKK